jgi:hypothetical protein
MVHNTTISYMDYNVETRLKCDTYTCTLFDLEFGIIKYGNCNSKLAFPIIVHEDQWDIQIAKKVFDK